MRVEPFPLEPLPPVPTVSILVTCYNYGRFLDECLESCLRQSQPVTEVVVVDDGSTDDSHERLLRWCKRDKRVVMVSQQNAGVSAATATGLTRCRGDIILLVDADDRCAPDRVEKVVAAFQRASAGVLPGWVHHPLRKFTEQTPDLGTMPTHLTGAPEGYLADLIVKTGGTPLATPTSGLALRRSLLPRILPLDEHRESAQDLQLWYLLPLAATGRWIPDALGDYRVHGSSNSGGGGAGQLTSPRLIRRQRQRYERCHAQVARWLEVNAPGALSALPPVETSLTQLGLVFLDTWYNSGRRDRPVLRRMWNHPEFSTQSWQQRWFWRAAGYLPWPVFRWFSGVVFGSGLIKRTLRFLLGRR